MVKRTAWFSATVLTNNCGNCLPSSLLFWLNYCVVAILVYIYAQLVYVNAHRISFKYRIHMLRILEPRHWRLAVWLSGNALASINVVALRQTQLVLGWVIVCGRVNHFGM